MLGWEIPRRSQLVNLGWLLLTGRESHEVSCCLFDMIQQVMKPESRPAIHMKKQLGWAQKLGGTEFLETSKASQTVLARLMVSQIGHQLAGSVEGGFRKGTMASAHLDARPFSFSLYITGAFQVATLVLELRGSESA